MYVTDRFHLTAVPLNLDPVQEGREAYLACYSLSDCPYEKDSPSEKAWFKGWIEEDMKFRERWRKKRASPLT